MATSEAINAIYDLEGVLERASKTFLDTRSIGLPVVTPESFESYNHTDPRIELVALIGRSEERFAPTSKFPVGNLSQVRRINAAWSFTLNLNIVTKFSLSVQTGGRIDHRAALCALRFALADMRHEINGEAGLEKHRIDDLICSGTSRSFQRDSGIEITSLQLSGRISIQADAWVDLYPV